MRKENSNQLTERKFFTTEPEDDEDFQSEDIAPVKALNDSGREQVTRAIKFRDKLNVDEDEDVNATFESVAEEVGEKKVPPISFMDSKRRANCCSIFTFWYSNTLVASVYLNKGKLINKMIEDMNSDPLRDEKMLATF